MTVAQGGQLWLKVIELSMYLNRYYYDHNRDEFPCTAVLYFLRYFLWQSVLPIHGSSLMNWTQVECLRIHEILYLYFHFIGFVIRNRKRIYYAIINYIPKWTHMISGYVFDVNSIITFWNGVSI